MYDAFRNANLNSAGATANKQGATVGLCFKCNQPGHWSNRCPAGTNPGASAVQPSFSSSAYPRGPAFPNSTNQQRATATPKAAAPPASKPLRQCPNCGAAVAPRKRKCESCQTPIAPQRAKRGAPGGEAEEGGGDYDDC